MLQWSGVFTCAALIYALLLLVMIVTNTDHHCPACSRARSIQRTSLQAALRAPYYALMSDSTLVCALGLRRSGTDSPRRCDSTLRDVEDVSMEVYGLVA